jgi:hypothetical protein
VFENNGKHSMMGFFFVSCLIIRLHIDDNSFSNLIFFGPCGLGNFGFFSQKSFHTLLFDLKLGSTIKITQTNKHSLHDLHTIYYLKHLKLIKVLYN